MILDGREALHAEKLEKPHGYIKTMGEQYV